MSAKAEGPPRVIGAFLAVPNDFILSSLYSTTGWRCPHRVGAREHQAEACTLWIGGRPILACNRPASQPDGGMIATAC
jgi:aerobic-type carbon monoxide dehydrogenase small subunit (CoxS/CutS family)